MILAPASDDYSVIVGYFILFFHFVAFVLVVLLEGVVLYKLKWNAFKRSLLDSFLVNLVTTIIGLILASVFSFPFWDRFSYTLGMILSVALLWGLSMLIEGGLLFVIGRKSLAKAYRAAFFINISSYILLCILYLVLF
ncbi:MAG: hypothetical protein A2Z14_13280 [Chloroflexi bacterium RBG_16_48_8]|nr:MAG: hypothetical protein A2Z14_13280 [Chloroflexi bacterium RBG_16_48_8]